MGTPAVVALEAAGVSFEVVAYERGASGAGSGLGYGLDAAASLGLDPRSVFKTLVASLDTGELVTACVPTDGLLDLRSLARVAEAKKATMADPVVAERSTGYVLGGISPFGQRKRLRTFIDETVELFDIVHISAGRRGLEIALSPADLIACSGAVLVDLAK